MSAQVSTAKLPGKLFKVVVIGATQADLNVFHRIFGITRYRPRRYELLVVSEASSVVEISKIKEADIYVVNINSPTSVRYWQTIASSIPPEHRKPVLKISKVTPSSEAGAEFTISWPINPAKMLQTLDNYTIRHLHYYPEFEIGSDVEPCANTIKHISAINTSINSQQKEESEQKIVRVLVADDSLAVRRQLKMEFDMINADLNLVADGEAAVAAAQTEVFDIIFLDVVMPGIDGYSVCKQIRKSKLNKNTPIVMLTSRSSKFDKLKGVLAGCDTYLTKPVNHNEFLDVTQKHLSKILEKNE